LEEKPDLPSVDEIRRRIELIPEKSIQMACKALYLLAARASEIVGRAYVYERFYGVRGVDAHLDYYLLDNRKIDAVVFRLKTAKRKGTPRNIGLPLDYEPWAKELFDYFQQFGNDYVFPFTRQELWFQAKKHFKDLTYKVYEYPYVDKKTGELKWKEAHDKSFTLHALRHLRSVELVEFYGFDGFNLSAYCGWTIRSGQARFGVSVSPAMTRYIHLAWQGYFPKLLKKR